MNCETAQEELVTQLLDELEPPRAAELAAHLAECAACRARQAEHARLVGAARALAPLEPSAEERRCLVERVLAAVVARRERERKGHRRLRDSAVRRPAGLRGWMRGVVSSPLYFGVAAAAVLLIVVCATFIQTRGLQAPDMVGPLVTSQDFYSPQHQARARMMRQNCREVFDRQLEGGAVSLEGLRDIAAYDTVRLVPLAIGSRERLLVLLTADEWQTIEERKPAANLATDTELAMLANRGSVKAAIEESRLTIPPELLAYVSDGGETGLRVLRFETRTEIWSTSRWDAYQSVVPIMLGACLLPTFGN